MAILLGAAHSFVASSHVGVSLSPGFAATELTWGAAAAGFFAVVAYVDAVLQILSDLLVTLVVVAASLSAASRGTDNPLVAAVTGASPFLTVFVLASATSLGCSNAKLTGVLGLWTGQPQPLILGLTVGVACAGIAACALLVIGKIDHRTTVALGPWLVVGASVAWTESGQRRIK